MRARITIGVIFAIAALFLLSLGALQFMIYNFPTLSEGHGAFAGALMGALFGLAAVALSAWYGLRSLKDANEQQADLRRREEEGRREFEKITLAAALRAEIKYFRTILTNFIDIYTREPNEYVPRIQIYGTKVLNMPVPDPTLFNANAGQIGILGAHAAGLVVTTYSQMIDFKMRQEVIPSIVPPDAQSYFDAKLVLMRNRIKALDIAITALDEFTPPEDA